jgi:O-antigen ligase
MAFHGILQIHGGVGFGGLPPEWRPTGEDTGVYQIAAFGLFGDPNDLCLAFITGIPLAWAEFRTAGNPLIRGAAFALIPLYGYAAILTNSRGGVIGLFGMCAAYAVSVTKGMRRWIIASFSIALITVVAPARFTGGMDVEMGRVNAWGDGLAAFQRFPVFGVGYHAFVDQASTENKAAHNSYINALAELGVVGYTPWFLLLFFTAIYLRRTIILTNTFPKHTRSRLVGLMSALIGYFTSIYFLSRSYHPFLFILLALGICQTVIVSQSHGLLDMVFGGFRKDLRRGLILCASSILFLWFTIRIANRLAQR